jgi:lambda repressor-like predicted transcriptional regulator
MAEHENRDEHWADLIGEWRTSGLSQAEFCRRRGISDRSLSNWLHNSPYRERIARVLAARTQGDIHPETPRFVPVSVVTMTSASNAQHTSVSSSAIEIVLPGGPRIVVTSGFDAETLRRVVAALEARPC